MSKKRSLVSSFSELANSKPADPVQVPRVSAGIIGATQRTLTEIREERDRLAEQVALGGFLEIAPELVDPSPFPDRLPDDDQTEFERFRVSMEEDGQKVPVQVRRHPSVEGRYQLVYGHRRLRAARELNRPLKAFVVEASDHDLLLAQGLENSARQDLSWIEKASFAARMEGAGIKARDIRSALQVDDAELARFRSVLSSLGDEIPSLIGRASKIGRPRWTALAAQVAKTPDGIQQLVKILAAAKDVSSNERFALCLKALTEPREPRPFPALPLERNDGTSFGRVLFSPKAIQIEIAEEEANDFQSFFEARLPELVEQFRQQSRKP
ncbi:MAG: plasmid partitioning protein RepB [Microcystis sp. LE19-98.1E]|nr:plasmid partitioning protein RepB [Brevundimonas sp.]MCZ8308677.1 plasmid partitioning protein RepB [Microcystis sp. LE19-98.1E]